MRVTVVVLTCNQRRTTERCLESLRRTGGSSFDVLVWDNGSTDGTVEALAEAFPEVRVHRHPENLGVASGRNAAARLAIESLAPDALLFLDNDTVVEPGFIEALAAPFTTHPTLGQTQAKLRFLEDRERLNDGGGCRLQFWLGRTRPVGYGELDRGQYDRPAPCIACGGAMMVRTELFMQLGGFDPLFDPFGPEDLDFSLRLQRAGFGSLYVPQALAFHEVSHTFEPQGYTERYARHKARHWFLLLRRHATPVEKAGFYLVGLPYTGLRLVLREAAQGNLRGLLGLFRGAADALSRH